MKRVVIVSDFHCGHQVGLTPPDFDAVPSSEGQRRQLYKTRRRCWDFYKETIEALKPIDLLIVNGDCVDGKAPRSGGTELITSDRTEQVDMAAQAIKIADASNVVMSYGTPYHTGDLEDWENEVAKQVEALKIGGHDWVDVNGLVFDYKHFVGSSAVPYGRHTAVARDRLWGILWAEHGEYPRGDIIVRSHVHYFDYCGGFGWLGLTTPALQFYGTKFGTRKATGTVDYGLVSFDVESKEKYSWQSHVFKPRLSRQHVITV